MQQYMSDDPRPIKERLGYDPFADEVLPPIITVEELDSDFDNGFHVDIVDGLEVGSLLVTDDDQREIVRVRAMSTVGEEKFLMFDRGYTYSPRSEIKVGTRLIVIGWEEPKDLYPLMVTTVTKDNE